jgi:hypothetical protein
MHADWPWTHPNIDARYRMPKFLRKLDDCQSETFSEAAVKLHHRVSNQWHFLAAHVSAAQSLPQQLRQGMIP